MLRGRWLAWGGGRKPALAMCASLGVIPMVKSGLAKRLAVPASSRYGSEKAKGTAVDFSTYLDFLKRMFLSDTESFSLNPDLVRDIVFTLVTFLLGWAMSLKASKQRLKSRIIDELILSQRELVARAYPETRNLKWKANDDREVWMLDPFVARIKFLISSLSEEKSLNQKQLALLENYVVALEAFIACWANTWARKSTYNESYKVTYNTFRAAVIDLGLHQTRRLNGLMPKDSLLSGLAKETANMATSTPHVVPAE